MNIIVGKNSGFCAGVKHTITKAKEELSKSENGIDCLGEIIHNEQVVNDLEELGLRIINKIEDAKGKVIIRAHGIAKDVYDHSKKHNIELIDLTCPNVVKIHNQVEKLSKSGYFIFLFGVKNHPETIGTYSFCGKNSYILEGIDDISPALNSLKTSNLNNVLIISQTTFSLNLFEKMTKMVLDELGNNFNVQVEKSICNATDLRQKEAFEISSKVQLMIIIGGKNSSNTKKLYEVSKENCKNVLSIQTKDDLDINFVKQFENVGVIAGASTPDYIIQDVINTLSKL